MGSVVEHLNPTLLRDWLHASVDQLVYAPFWFAVLQIIFVDLLLSGDNSVVIAMACRGLPPQQRRWGIVIGAGVAVILRVVFIGIIAQLMLLPYFKLTGGVALVLIAARLVVPESAGENEIRAVAHLWRAVMIIAVADVVMSLDNVIAIAAIAKGNLLLLLIGLIISIPLIMAGAALIMTVLDRFPILVGGGVALLGWIAGETIATDPAVGHFLAAFGEEFSRRVTFAAAGASTLLTIGLGGVWRRCHQARIQAGSSGGAAVAR